MSKRLDTLLDLHQASAMLHQAFTKATDADDTELASEIRIAQLQVGVAIQLLVAIGIAEDRARAGRPSA